MSARPTIFTLTGNLLAERTLEFGPWQIGSTQRALHESFHTRGKGVNVTKMLQRLGTASTALLFAGGPSGEECEAWLRQHELPYRCFAINAGTRTGTVIWSEQVPETTFLGPDVIPDDEAVRACANFLNAQPDDQVLALCGSFPGWDELVYAPLRSAIDRWIDRGRLFADVYGPPLKSLVERPLELIKINQQEFAAFFPATERAVSTEQRLRAMSQRSPVKQWVISNGPRSVWVLPRRGDPIEIAPPPVKEVSPTGSGDVLFAAILHALLIRGTSLVEAVDFGLPLASANAAHPSVADFVLPANL